MRSVLRRSNGVVLLTSLLALGISTFDLTTERHPAYSQQRSKLTQEQISALQNLEGAFSAIADTVEPAVVQIRTETARPKMQENPGAPPNPLGEMFPGIPFQVPPQVMPPEGGGGTGSGVIVKIEGKDAYILTNSHVVNGAAKITVVFQDGTEVSGKDAVTVRGSDSLDDLAVIKMTTETPLDPNRYQARLGDSDQLRVGQWAIAIGSPFGLQSSFTMGVISALDRSQRIQNTDYNDFIQTDAAINPGNSGGALVNIHGEVIGINTAIATGGARASAGVGFAIPINKAKQIMEQLITRGRVVRGYVGVRLKELDPGLKQLTGAQSGVFISDVSPNTPGAKAGIQPEDVITDFNGKQVHSSAQLQEMVRATAPNTRVQLGIIRKKQPMKLALTLEELPAEQSVAVHPNSDTNRRATRLGLRVQALTPQSAESMKLPAGTKGVLVAQVMPGSLAADAGLMQGDIIQKVNGQPVNDVASFERGLESLKEKDLIFLRVLHVADGQTMGDTISINPADE